jgi:hypothetical protein
MSHGGPKKVLLMFKGQIFSFFYIYKGCFQAKLTNFLTLRARLKPSAGHIRPAGGTLCMPGLDVNKIWQSCVKSKRVPKLEFRLKFEVCAFERKKLFAAQKKNILILYLTRISKLFWLKIFRKTTSKC